MPQPASNADPADALDELRAAHGLDFARTRRVLCLASDGRWQTVTGLVERTGASRRWVEETVDALAGWLDRDGDRLRVARDHAEHVRKLAECESALPAGFDRPDLSGGNRPEVLRRMREAAAGLPPSVAALDHVPATSETAVRRAYALAANYDLAGRHVLCLGDHDLTSIALAVVEPRAQVSVLDIDERILAHIGGLAARLDLPVRTHFADLRTELAPSLRETVDLVFTDPPYTPAGIELFLARAITSLRRHRNSRVLFCFSHNERQPARGLEVQNVVSALQLSLDALLPEFNEFTGAESIGSRSALWICRPTTKSWPAAERRSSGTAIYTRGRQAEETGDRGAGSLLQRLRAEAGDGPVQEIGTAEQAALGLDAVLRTEPPAGQGGMLRPGATVVADLTEVHPSYAYRLLLRTLPAERVLAAVRPDPAAPAVTDLTGPVWRMLGARYRIRSRRESGDTLVIDATRRPADDVPDALRVARYVVEHPRARLLGAWREALIADARRRGGTLSKNEARARIAEAVAAPETEGRFLIELPHAVIERVASSMLD